MVVDQYLASTDVPVKHYNKMFKNNWVKMVGVLALEPKAKGGERERDKENPEIKVWKNRTKLQNIKHWDQVVWQ